MWELYISLTLYMEVLEMDHFVYDPLPGFVHFQAEGKLNSSNTDKRTIFPDLIFIHRMIENPRYRCLRLPLLFFGVLKPRIRWWVSELKISYPTSQIRVEYPGMSCRSLIALISLSNFWGFFNSFSDIWIHFICQYTPIGKFNDEYIENKTKKRCVTVVLQALLFCCLLLMRM